MIALLMLLPWVASLLDPGYSHAGNFTIGLMLTAFVSGALLLSGYTSRRHRANGIELLLIMVLFWSFLPAIAAIPFIGASQIDGLVAAYFEAVSALTTSGGSMLSVPQAEATRFIVACRAELARRSLDIGVAVAVLAPFGIGGISLIGSPLLQHEENAPLSSRLGPLRLILPVYLMFTALGIIALLAFGSPLVEAVCLALSAVSTSGMVLRAKPFRFAERRRAGRDGIIMFCRLRQRADVDGADIGARGAKQFSVTEMRVYRSGIGLWRNIADCRADRWRAWCALAVDFPPQHGGFNFLPDGELASWPIVWVMVPVLIGGMALSTSGGVKVMRAIILAKDLGSGWVSFYPSSVHPLSLEGRHLQDRILMQLGPSLPYSFFLSASGFCCSVFSARHWPMHGRLFWVP